VVPHQNKFGMG